jgi:hypothetical protein
MAHTRMINTLAIFLLVVAIAAVAVVTTVF